MDSSNHGEYTRPSRFAGKGPEDVPSPDDEPVHSPHLQKQKSNAGMRSARRGHPTHSMSPSITAIRGNGAPADAFGNGVRARKGSIRNAVKKIFGRRSRDVVSQGSDVSVPVIRHTYHKSEPTALVPPPEEPEPDPFLHHGESVEQTLSYHFPAAPSPSFRRTGSPYAVQFPNSVRLKPMDLGNPFIGAPNQLRRRKTLPSVVLAERPADATTAASAQIQTGDADRLPNPNGARDTTVPIPIRLSTSVKKTRRKSRSADDLKTTSTVDLTSQRKRSDDIRYWRESFQPDVLRASGFTTRSPPRDDAAEETVSSLQRKSPKQKFAEEGPADNIPMPQALDPFASALSSSGTSKSSPPVHHHGRSVGEDSTRPSSGFGTEMSKDLEDRVAKLESGLHNFQRSLQRLTAERNRRTVILGGNITRRASNDMRSPSMLADTLADPLEPSSYEYDYGHTMRPSTSPRPRPPVQTQGTLEDPFGPEIPPPMPAPASERRADSLRLPNPLQSHPPAMPSTQPPAQAPVQTPVHSPTQLPPAPASGSSTSQPQPYTFRSLYQMLADERSARRKLENQLKGLRQEISDLHTQVSFSSNVQSTRSSYMLAGSSSRLQDLLRETESSPPGTSNSPRSHPRSSGQWTGVEPVMSRFSGSESEPGHMGEYDDLPTPHDAYQTPREQGSNFSLRNAVTVDNGDGDMF